jgi:pentatricopeptide repeat protein
MLGQDKKRGKIRAFVKYLVERRAQTPNAMLYEALITSNWDLCGSAEEVREILDEMQTMGVGGTSSLYHAALRALAVHPDYILRNRIISEMKERWLDITVDGQCSIALGLLRDGQHEMALDNLEQMMDGGLELPAWLHDIFIFVLSQHGFLDEAVALLQRLHQVKTQNLPANVWYFVLDECSRQYHYEGTKLAWDTVVQPKILVPSDGICLNVLNTASRYSDAKLATDVIRHLSARNVKLAAHHYEALVDCYANRDDVENALQALCIMAKAAGMGGGAAQQPCLASTHSVSLAFKRSASLARVGRDAILRLAETYTVPLAAFNVVVEGLCAGGDDGEAFELYQQIRHLCGCGPDFDTFRPLMERTWDQAAARFLVDEMQAFGVRPTREFYDRLVYLCATGGNLDGAFVALDELKRTFVPGVLPRPGEWVCKETALAVVRRCVAERDERLWNLLSFARRIGLDLGSAGRALAESAVSTRIGDGVVKEGERRVMGKESGEGQEGRMPWLDGELSVEEKMKAGARG